MSARHHDLSGISRPEVHAHQRQARQDVRAQLRRLDDLEDGDVLVPASSRATRQHSRPTAPAKGKVERTARGGPKVWKMKFWKRRNGARHQANLSWQRLAEADA